MIRFIKSLTGRLQSPSRPKPAVQDNRPAPVHINVPGVGQFTLAQHLSIRQGFPIADWRAISTWVDSLPGERTRDAAWAACEQGWLLHMKQALGAGFHLVESNRAMLLSSLTPNVAHATLAYMEQTQRRLGTLLEGIAKPDSLGKELMVVFDSQDQYYQYVCGYYPEKGEFSLSSGMYIHRGCGHFVTTQADLSVIEPIIVHEMTHSMLSYLPMPTWLNEGIAVSSERRLAGPPAPNHHIRDKHRQVWNEHSIQQFWSGDAFMQSGDISQLAYDLAQTVVEQLARDWHGFKRFVTAAHRNDAGKAAAEDILGIDLGRFVALIMAREDGSDWSPQPQQWAKAPVGQELEFTA
ncbi:hypothetical protein [Chitinivorax sp. B]|uniref:hypothetical protein n=1 Tax=Chitinivorax sp. B TaxID=2502235 RepID=UPI0010FA0388|nr:hypothetical protein [Chitinivorax sp. B]